MLILLTKIKPTQDACVKLCPVLHAQWTFPWLKNYEVAIKLLDIGKD